MYKQQMMSIDLRYPIGRFAPAPPSAEVRRTAVDDIAALPRALRQAVRGLTDAQLDTPYRPQGWTVRQVVHHVADSHMNGFIRMKLALTERHPTIKPYDENAWSSLPDMRLPVDISLEILDNLHARWVAVYTGMAAPEFERTFHHPELGTLTLDRHVQLYAWHSKHHTGHITELRRRETW